MGRRKRIVKNVNANIPVSLSWLLRPFWAFLCFPGSAQFIASSKRGQPRFCREIELGHYELEAMSGAEPEKERKAKKGRRSHDRNTGMFAFAFLTITSFPATYEKT